MLASLRPDCPNTCVSHQLGNGMTQPVNLHARPDFLHLRVAFPAIRAHRYHRSDAALKQRTDEFRALYDQGLRPIDALHLRLTEAERLELNRASRIRTALYGEPGLA